MNTINGADPGVGYLVGDQRTVDAGRQVKDVQRQGGGRVGWQ